MYGSNKMYLIIGSYSDGTTPGISVYTFDIETGDFSLVSYVKDVINPSFLAVSPDETLIYSVNEVRDGAVSAFSFDRESGTLTFINSQPTQGADPCHINIDRRQNFIVTANYTGGSLSYFPLAQDGSIEPVQKVWDMNILFGSDDDEAVSHIHMSIFSPCHRFLFVTDLGFDKIYRFNVEADNTLTLDTAHITSLPVGSGPRHLAFSPNGRFLYCINEHAGTVTVFRHRNGRLRPLQTIKTDDDERTRPRGSADIRLTPDGRFLYASNRLRNDGIAIFSVHPRRGTLTKTGYQTTGVHPRNFTISPNGRFLLSANRNSHNVQIFRINQRTGLLMDTGREISLRQPVCLKWINK
jgi:6-phosphogluconolactonase (cycloisomerase 2 family)